MEEVLPDEKMLGRTLTTSSVAASVRSQNRPQHPTQGADERKYELLFRKKIASLLSREFAYLQEIASFARNLSHFGPRGHRSNFLRADAHCSLWAPARLSFGGIVSSVSRDRCG